MKRFELLARGVRAIRLAVAVGLGVLLATAGAQATSITFTCEGGLDPLSPNVAASATFSRVTKNNSTFLVVTLTNTSKAVTGFDSRVNADLLSAVFFDLEGAPTLDPVSALLGEEAIHGVDSHVYLDGAIYANDPGPGGSVGAHWAYSEGSTFPADAPEELTAAYGIRSAGLDVEGSNGKEYFPGTKLGGENNPPDGPPYNILSEGSDLTVFNSAWKPFIMGTVEFTLDGLPSDFDPSTDVSNVFFQYGTDWQTEPGIPGKPPNEQPPIPEPLSLAGVLLGLGGLTGYVRRRAGR